MNSKWIWIAAAAAGAYALYEWLSRQCETPSSSFYGGSFCTSLFPSAAATVQIPTQVTTVTSVTSAQATQLAAYGLPADAVPSSTYPSQNNCTVVNPTESGYSPTSGAPFYSPSLGQYLCGPSTLWQSMQAPVIGPPMVMSLPGPTPITEAAQANAGPVNGACVPGTLPAGQVSTIACPAGYMPSGGGVSVPVGGIMPPSGVSGLNRIPATFIHRRAA
jgi:hypothetical protein